MTNRILIRHVSGARSNQIDEFPAAAFREIVAGREDGSAIRFDPERDDLVSRHHVRIAADPSAPGSFLIADLQSRNGTFLNRERITQPTRIQHLDTVQLGPGGPEFRFELDPPPVSAAKPTRLVEQGGLGGLAPRPTRESTVPSLAGPRPVGRATVERMLDDTFGKVRKESKKSLWVGVATAVLIAGTTAGSWWYVRASNQQEARRAQDQQAMLLQMSQIVRRQPNSDAALQQRIDKISGELQKVVAQNEALKRAAAAGDAQAAAGQAPAQPSADPPADYNAGLRQAMQLYKSGDYADAYQQAAQIIGEDGSRWEGYYVAGNSLAGLNRPTEAQSMFQYALAEAPDNVKPSIQQQLGASQNGGAASSN